MRTAGCHFVLASCFKSKRHRPSSAVAKDRVHHNLAYVCLNVTYGSNACEPWLQSQPHSVSWMGTCGKTAIGNIDADIARATNIALCVYIINVSAGSSDMDISLSMYRSMCWRGVFAVSWHWSGLLHPKTVTFVMYRHGTYRQVLGRSNLDCCGCFCVWVLLLLLEESLNLSNPHRLLSVQFPLYEGWDEEEVGVIVCRHWLSSALVLFRSSRKVFPAQLRWIMLWIIREWLSQNKRLHSLNIKGCDIFSLFTWLCLSKWYIIYLW